MKREDVGKRIEINPIAWGPAFALLVLLLSFIFAR
jgi:hypothetical protein